MKRSSVVILLVLLLALGAAGVFWAKSLQPSLPPAGTLIPTNSHSQDVASDTNGTSASSTPAEVPNSRFSLKCTEASYENQDAPVDCTGVVRPGGPTLAFHLNPSHPDSSKDGGTLTVTIKSGDGSVNQSIQTSYADDVELSASRSSLGLDDYNFDGYADIALGTSFGATNFGSDIWLYSPSMHKFVKEDSLSDLSNVYPDPASKTVIAHSNFGGAGCDFVEETYKQGSDGHFIKIKEATQMLDDTATEDIRTQTETLTVKVLDRATGIWKETVTHPTDCVDWLNKQQ